MTVDTTKSIPTIQQYGLEPGAKTPMESAQMKAANATAEQNANNQQAGSRSKRRNKCRSRCKRRSKRRSRSKLKGGKGDQPGPNEIVVPQPTTFTEPIGPVDANANTTATTSTLTNAVAQAEFDKNVGQNAGAKRRTYKYKKNNRRNKFQVGCSNGGKRKTKKYKRSNRKRKSKKTKGSRHNKRRTVK